MSIVSKWEKNGLAPEALSQLPCCMFWKDKKGIYLGCNDAFAGLMGCSTPDEIVGKTDYDFFNSKELCKAYRSDDKHVIETHQPKINFEEDHILPSGKKIVLLTSKVPFLDKDGQIIGVLGVCFDITERKNKETSLQQEKKIAETENQAKSKFIADLLEQLPSYIFWKDKDCVFLGCNELFAHSAGLSSPKEIIGKTDYDLAWKEQGDFYRADDREVMKTGLAKLNIEELQVTPAGQKINLLTSKVPLFDNNNTVIGILGIYIDITARKKAEEERDEARVAAEIASHAKSEFIANMSHDVRTPLTGLIGLLQELIDSADDALVSLEQSLASNNNKSQEKYIVLLNKFIEKVQENGHLALGATDELLQFLNEILETMRLDSGKAAEEAESFNLQELIEHNIELMLPVAQHKRLTLSYELDERIPAYFSGIRHYLDRSLLNLLSNALKFTKEGFVKLKVEKLGEHHSNYHLNDEVKLKISVQDSGIGIPEDKFATIFEHFSRLTSSHQGLYKGAGLGLYTVERYIQAMNASIRVESTVGKGTSFIIELPLTVSDHSDREKTSYRRPKVTVKKAPLIQAMTSLQTETAKTDATTKILIVEDNPLAARMVLFNIKRLYSHCACEVAETGMAAVKMAEENHYDFILMDIGLPDIDGIEVAKQIRASDNPQVALVSIVALTGHGNDPEIRKEALAAGMQDVLAKPLTVPQLESLFQQYIFVSEPEVSPKDNSIISKAEEGWQVVDWPQSVEKCAGDEILARELLSELALDLKMFQEKLAKSYAAQDNEAMRAELHRVRGGVVYLALPQLDSTLAVFHEAVKAEPQDSKQLDQLYNQLQQAMEAFWEYRRSF